MSIMQKTEPTNDLLSQMKVMLAPVNTQQTLSQQVATLTEVQQRQVMSFAQLLKTEDRPAFLDDLLGEL